MADRKRWINFARWSDRSNCIGKGRIMDCDYSRGEGTVEGLYIKMTLNGVLFEGILPLIISEEEE
tara:strand:+ start:4321 stop:4515 length:195 start_codon:yes stop_codon:yes gene_type:complete